MKATNAISAVGVQTKAKRALVGASRHPFRALCHSPDAPCLLKFEQVFTRQEQIGQSGNHEGPVTLHVLGRGSDVDGRRIDDGADAHSRPLGLPVPAVYGFRIHRLRQGVQSRLRHHRLHLGQKRHVSRRAGQNLLSSTTSFHRFRPRGHG